MLELCALSTHSLIKAQGDQTVQQLALAEGGKVKKLIGYLRYLCRNRVQLWQEMR